MVAHPDFVLGQTSALELSDVITASSQYQNLISAGYTPGNAQIIITNNRNDS